MKAISLFSCGGIGDLALHAVGIHTILANEILSERAEVFKYNYPNTHMIVGDIWEKRDEILQTLDNLLDEDEKLDIVFATPPCQGMSKNGRGKLLNGIRNGLKTALDPRNMLIVPTIEIFLKSNAHTLIMENVPEMNTTLISDPNNPEELINLMDWVKLTLGKEFKHCIQIVEFANYGVPQSRQRLISIFTKNQSLVKVLVKEKTLFPLETHSKNGVNGKKWVTVRDAISHTPFLDAGSSETAKCKEIPYHKVPLLDNDKYFWVKHTKEEQGAFNNQCVNPSCGYDKNPTHGSSRNKEGINRANEDTPIYCVKCGELLPRPWVKDGDKYRLMKGYTSAYKRMSWDSPASTLTTNFSYACSDNKLHPSQNRVLSIYEAMLLHTLTDYDYSFARADGKKTSDKLIRELIAESIPPRGLEYIFNHLKEIIENGRSLKSNPQDELLELELIV